MNNSQAIGSIQLIHGSSQSPQNVGVGFLKDPSLMGTFSLPPPSNLAKVATVGTCHMISSTSSKIKKDSDDFDSVDHSEVFIVENPTDMTQLSNVIQYVLRALDPDVSFMTHYE